MFDFRTPLDRFLDPGERLLWSGQPQQGIRLQAADVFMIPFSLMWGGFAIFWEFGALTMVHGVHANHGVTGPATLFAWIFPLWGVPFVAIGLYMIFGRFFYDAAARKRTWYGVTDRRLIVLRSLFGQTVRSYDYANLQNLNLVERGDRSGDIQFALPMPDFTYGTRRGRRPVIPGFYLVPDVRDVYSQVLAAQSQAKK